MKKALIVVSVILSALVLLGLGLLLTHPWWFAPAAKGLANSIVPDVTGTGFRVDGLGLNAYNGRFSASGIVLENPEGYSERVALKVGRIDVLVDMASVVSNVVILKEVDIKDVFVSYVSKDGENNFDRIIKNASGEKKKASDDGSAAEEGTSADVADDQLRVVIERLNIDGASVKMGIITLPVPPIRLTDIGKKSGGVTAIELGNQLLTAIVGAVGSAKDGLGALGAVLGESAKDLKVQLERNDMKGVEESVRKGADALKDAKNVLKSFFE